jgi:ribosome-associated translation inhibitor RaiA
MELLIRTRSVELTDTLREQVVRRLKRALDTFEDRITETRVYLMDLNGPRGGVDKLCQLSIYIPGVGDVVIRETGSTVHAAFNRAVRRVKYRVSEALRQADGSSTGESIRTGTAAA